MPVLRLGFRPSGGAGLWVPGMESTIRGIRTSAVSIATALLGAAVISGCGDDEEYANEPRPPAPIVIAASISGEAVSVSPKNFGAGPINLIITNQSDASQQITLESDEVDRAGLRQETGPINPSDTATLKADIKPGVYRVHVDGGSIRGARITVGRARNSAQNDLLQP